MRQPVIDINPGSVVIEGQRVERPSGMSVSDWLEFWERSKLTSWELRRRYSYS